MLSRIGCCVLCAVVAAACEAPGSPALGDVVSPGGTYLLRLSGHVTKPVLFEHPVRAEVYKNGALHVPSRRIYVSDLFETAFQNRFGSAEWVAANVVRFPARYQSGNGRPDALIVRNTGQQLFRCVRIETGTDMFIVVDLGPGDVLSLPLTAEWRARRLSWLDVVVDSGEAGPLLRGNGAFDVRRDRTVPHQFAVAISPNGIDVTETTGGAELYR